ncbi:hypothetical protein DVH24_006222 [Malus domestica]|uniref:Uncharacterized protein n=1 Tax=Malus domestica TaxID=3750 RepID=A0A498KGS0_MALDO|nr:hypothetical protein DVH24_006222 [Malus domestica]
MDREIKIDRERERDEEEEEEAWLCAIFGYTLFEKPFFIILFSFALLKPSFEFLGFTVLISLLLHNLLVFASHPSVGRSFSHFLIPYLKRAYKIENWYAACQGKAAGEAKTDASFRNQYSLTVVNTKVQAWHEEVDCARQGQRDAEGKLSSLEVTEVQKMRVEMASMKRDVEHYSRHVKYASSPFEHMELRKRYRELTDLLVIGVDLPTKKNHSKKLNLAETEPKKTKTEKNRKNIEPNRTEISVWFRFWQKTEPFQTEPSPNW